MQPGDTFASALHRAGHRVLSRSLKYHRPRGLYCVQGSCGSCFVNVDGTPNVPACTAAARDGCALSGQNVIGSARHDLLGVVDKVYWNGFDPHNAFTRPRIVNEVFLKGVRLLSGLGKPPPPGVHVEGPRRHTLQVDELVVGSGRQGLMRAREAGRLHPRVLLVDELPHLGGSARWDPLEMDTRLLVEELPKWPTVEAWDRTLCFGIYGGQTSGTPPVAALRRVAADGHEDLVEISARRITLCTGAHDAWPLFTNNDLPGVLSFRGAMRLLGEHKVVPGLRIVVHGDPIPHPAVAMLQNAGAEVVAQGTVTAARGGTQVEAARIHDDWVACDTILCNLPRTPRVELYQQAGCELGWQRGALAPKAAHDGTTSRHGIYAGLPRGPA